jgi:hypothetical protein
VCVYGDAYADMLADGRVALSISAPGFGSLADGRFTLQVRQLFSTVQGWN